MLEVETSVPTETLRRWTSRVALARNASPAMIPIEIVGDVEVNEADERRVRIVTRGGHRIEGITIAEAIAVVRVLG